MTKYAIIGAGIAGISAAEAIRENDHDGEILLINGEKAPPYCRPLIVEVLRGERPFDAIHLRDPDWYEARNITLINGDPVSEFNPVDKTLVLNSGQEIKCGKILIATGSKPFTPPIKGLDVVPYHTLYCADDIERLKSECKSGSKALLVGVGLIGLQALASLVELGVEVSAVELMPKIMPLLLDLKAAKYAEAELEKHGVRVQTGTGVSELKTNGAGYLALTDKDEEIEFDFLVMATGMRPDLELVEGTAIEIDRGIVVSAEMETSIEGIYAAGDITVYNNSIEGRPEIHAHWVNAYRQGRIAGHNMAGGNSGAYEPVFLNSLKVFDLPIVTIGASRLDETDNAQVFVTEAPDRPSYKRFVIRDGVMIAATFVNDVEGAGVYHDLIRDKVDIGEVIESLFKLGLEGIEFLYKHHDDEIRGNVDWPLSMSQIEWFEKDHSRTRWGKKGDAR